MVCYDVITVISYGDVIGACNGSVVTCTRVKPFAAKLRPV